MSSREFAEWMAYEQVTGPLGPERFDVLHAIHMAMLYNQWATKGKEKKPKEFLPDWDRKAREQTPEQMLGVFRMWAAATGGNVIDRSGG